jgi:site-specific recombinase XerD
MSFLEIWLSEFESENTRRAYRKEIAAFALFCEWKDTEAFASYLLEASHESVLRWAETWRGDKAARGLSASSSNRSMAAINSFFACARKNGLTNTRLDLKGETVPVRIREGIGANAVKALMIAAMKGKPHEAARDLAILFLIYNCGLTGSEVSALNIADVDLVQETIRLDADVFDLPPEVVQVLRKWLLSKRASFGDGEPLFVSLTGPSIGQRITASGVANIFERLGNRVGVKVNPGALRAEAIAEFVRNCDGNLTHAFAAARRKQMRAA